MPIRYFRRSYFSFLFRRCSKSRGDFGGCCIGVRERKSHIIAGSTGATRLRIPVGNNVTSVLSIVLHVVPRKTDTPLWPRKSRNIVSLSLSLVSPPPLVRSRFRGGRGMPESRCFVREVANTIRRRSRSRNENRAETRKIKINSRARRY